MKFLKASLLLMSILAFASCGDDDACTQSDWVGVYTGTANCDGTSENVTVTITASGSENIKIVYETPTVLTEYDPFTPDGCSLNVSQSQAGASISVNATLDGESLSLTEAIDFGGLSTNCSISASRQ